MSRVNEALSNDFLDDISFNNNEARGSMKRFMVGDRVAVICTIKEIREDVSGVKYVVSVGEDLFCNTMLLKPNDMKEFIDVQN